MKPDYIGAIVVEAKNYGYGARNNPKAWCLHTPEEPADSNPITPYYFHNTDRQASTHYYVSYTGLVFQCVPEDEGAYANGVEGKPWPEWANPDVNLNLQTLSIELEGYAKSIHETMKRGEPQWNATITLMADRCKERGIDPELTFPHFAVSRYRSDPGALDIAQLITDVKGIIYEDGGDDLRAAIIDAGGNYYFVGPGYRTYLGTTPTGLAEMGYPIIPVGADGAPKSYDSLFAIPSMEEITIKEMLTRLKND